MWLDRCSRKIVGWDVPDTMPEDLVSEVRAPGRAPAELVVPSDQGMPDSKPWWPNMARRKA